MQFASIGCLQCLECNGTVRGIGQAHEKGMKTKLFRQRAQGKVGWIMLWLLGVPLPILFILFLLRGCT